MQEPNQQEDEFKTVRNVILIFCLFSLFPGLIYYYYAQEHFSGNKIIHGLVAVFGGIVIGYGASSLKIVRNFLAHILSVLAIVGMSWW